MAEQVHCGTPMNKVEDVADYIYDHQGYVDIETLKKLSGIHENFILAYLPQLGYAKSKNKKRWIRKGE